MLHHLVCVRGKEAFGLALWIEGKGEREGLKAALGKARAMVRESGYSVYPAPKAQPEVEAKAPLKLAA